MSDKPVVLSEKEQRLIQELRKVDFGRFEIVIKNKQPVKMEKIRESIEL